MSEVPNDQEREDAATEAAQHVVDGVTSWEYSAEPETIQSRLDEGFDEAGVDVAETERRRLVEEIDEVKQHEDRGTPQVETARAVDDPQP
jgi:hypothetical protein